MGVSDSQRESSPQGPLPVPVTMNAHYVSFGSLALDEVLMGEGKQRDKRRGFLPQGSDKLTGECIHMNMFSNNFGCM